VPALQAAALPADAAAHAALTAKLTRLTLRPQTSSAAPAASRTLAGRRYAFGENPLAFEALSLDTTDGGQTTFTVRTGGADQTITAASGEWRKGTLTINGKPEPVAASGGWTSEDAYTLQVVRYGTPFTTTYKLLFSVDQLTVDSEQNVGPVNSRTAHFVGTSTPKVSSARE
jgi:hypothetical protein